MIHKEDKLRTKKQNNALHKYLGLLSEALNEAGYDMRTVLKPEVDIPWNKEMAKKFLWKPIQEVLTGKESTTEPTTVEYQEVYKVLDKHISEKFGIHIEWPHDENDISQGS
jgi:hypothetical protein